MTTTTPLSLARGLHLLEHLQNEGGISFSALCSQMSLPNTTVTRLLAALSELHYIQKSHDGLYHYCGPLASSTTNISDRLLQIASPIVHHMQRSMNNTALLLYWSGTHTYCLERVLHDSAAPLHGAGHIISDQRFTPWGFFLDDPYTWLDKKITPMNMPVKKYTKKIIKERLEVYHKHRYTYDLLPDRHRIATPIFYDDEISGILVLGGTPMSLPISLIKKYGKEMTTLADTAKKMLS
ncbi:MAG: helix-turn-helix domain-containing protein [Planctomycetes bacterium]|nr:helix-turn-helix domain-containing protein [Planctomycetota bacterium]